MLLPVTLKVWPSALAFSRDFYRALSAGYPVDAATVEAIRHVHLMPLIALWLLDEDGRKLTQWPKYAARQGWPEKKAKFHSENSILWQKRLDGDLDDVALSLAATADGVPYPMEPLVGASWLPLCRYL